MSGDISSVPSPGEPGETDPEPADYDPAGGDEIGEFLRERMLAAVSAIEARPGTLEYLRAAVPARRKRRQTVLAATTVAVLAVAGAVTVAWPGSGRVGTQTAASSGGSDLGSTPPGASPGANVGSSGRGQPRGTGPGHHPIPAYSSTLSMSIGPHGATAVQIPVPPPLVNIAGLGGTTPYCQNSSISPVAFTSGPDSNGISYETVTATAQRSCGISGPPVLTVVDGSGATAAVPVYREDGVAAPGLATVGGWGRQLTLNAGDKFMFQFAWVPTACSASGGPSPSSAAPTTPTDPSTSDSATVGAPSSSGTDGGASPAVGSPVLAEPSSPALSQPDLPYTVNFSVYGMSPVATVGFSAPCGAAIYTTDIYLPGEYPGPHRVSPIAPQVPSVSASTS